MNMIEWALNGSGDHEGGVASLLQHDLCEDGRLFSADARETVSDPNFSCSQSISMQICCLSNVHSGETEANRLRLLQGMTATSLFYIIYGRSFSTALIDLGLAPQLYKLLYPYIIETRNCYESLLSMDIVVCGAGLHQALLVVRSCTIISPSCSFMQL